MLQAHLVIADRETRKVLSVTRIDSEARSLADLMGRFAIVRVHQHHGQPGITVTADNSANFGLALRNGATEAKRLELAISAICVDESSFSVANSVPGIASTR